MIRFQDVLISSSRAELKIGWFKNKKITFIDLEKKKIGQCAILSAGMTYLLTYGSHKWVKLAQKPIFFLNPS